MFSVLKELGQTRRLSTIFIGLVAAAKIITDMLGWHVISNQELNDITNGAAAALTLITVVMSHVKQTGNVQNGSGASQTSGGNPDSGGSDPSTQVRGRRTITFHSSGRRSR